MENLVDKYAGLPELAILNIGAATVDNKPLGHNNKSLLSKATDFSCKEFTILRKT